MPDAWPSGPAAHATASMASDSEPGQQQGNSRGRQLLQRVNTMIELQPVQQTHNVARCCLLYSESITPARQLNDTDPPDPLCDTQDKIVHAAMTPLVSTSSPADR
jgi:hypothetical protein